MDWNTRLVVEVAGKAVCPIDSFNPTITAPAVPIHSIEADNVGVSYGPRTATFTMALKAIGAPVATLTKLALDRTRFSIGMMEVEDGSGDWSFTKLLFRDCIITSANPSNVMIDSCPAASFSGIILSFGESSDVQ